MGGCQNGGEGVVLLAAAAAMGLAQGKNSDEVALLAAFLPFWGTSWPFCHCAVETTGTEM